MKKLKTIKFLKKGNSLSNVEMGHILGGDYYYSDNNNYEQGCICNSADDSTTMR